MTRAGGGHATLPSVGHDGHGVHASAGVPHGGVCPGTEHGAEERNPSVLRDRLPSGVRERSARRQCVAAMPAPTHARPITGLPVGGQRRFRRRRAGTAAVALFCTPEAGPGVPRRLPGTVWRHTPRRRPGDDVPSPARDGAVSSVPGGVAGDAALGRFPTKRRRLVGATRRHDKGRTMCRERIRAERGPAYDSATDARYDR